MPTSREVAPFPPVAYAAWRAGVEAELGPEGVTSRLRASTEDGIFVEPLYAPGGPGDAEARDLAGRVMGLLPERNAGWRIRQRFPIGATGQVLREALACGVESLEFAGGGASNAFARSMDSLARLDPALLRGIELSWEDASPGEEGLISAGSHSLGLDPIGRWMRRGATTREVQDGIADGARRTLRPDGSLMLFRATGEPFHDAGATSGMTLGATMAAALTYLRAFEVTGTDLALAAGVIEVRLPCGPRFFEGAAMLRAARLVWGRILEASGIAPVPLRVVASTGRRTLTRHDPWNNALRNTSVAFAAAIGGADVLQLLPHDARNAESSSAALRLARTTGLILQEESHLGRVLDPAEGSWFLESLTSQLAAEAWGELRRLEAAGGIIPAIESGNVSGRIAEAAAARQERVRARQHPIIGVTEHPVEGEVLAPAAEEHPATAASSPFPFRPDAGSYEAGLR
jgi:methylmalonyl-CoA mutase